MKKIVLIIIFALIFNVKVQAQEHCAIKNKLSSQQFKKIEEAYEYGKADNLGYTLAAIIMVESKAGKFKVNDSTGSYGITHINIRTALSRMDMRNNARNRAKVRNMLIASDKLAFELAMEELLYWQSVRDNNWELMVKSYNAGWKHWHGKYYLDLVSKRVNQLEKCNLS